MGKNFERPWFDEPDEFPKYRMNSGTTSPRSPVRIRSMNGENVS